MATDGFIYEALGEDLIKRIDNTPGLGKHHSRKWVGIKLLERNIGSPELMFGKDIEMFFGTQYQTLSNPEGKKHFSHIISLVVDGPNTHQPDYKKSEELKTYTSDRGKIQPQSRTGLKSKTQRQLTLAIKRARHLALLPFVTKVK